LRPYDLDNARDGDRQLTRESIQSWLDCNAGDFQEILDFQADLEDGDVTVLIPWQDEESECVYTDCTSYHWGIFPYHNCIFTCYYYANSFILKNLTSLRNIYQRKRNISHPFHWILW